MIKKAVFRKLVSVLVALLVFVPTIQVSAAPVQPKWPYYDVIVIGSDPEGIAAAVSSARNGMKTLLVDKRTKVGGLFTLGGLNSLDMNYGPNRVLLTQGIFKEFFDALDPINPTGDFWGKRDSFDVEQAERIFLDMLQREPNITMMLGVESIQPLVEGDRISGVNVLSKGRMQRFVAGAYIDATQDADIAAMAGVPFWVGGQDINEPQQIQAITQVFKMENVDWDVLTTAIRNNRELYKADCNRYSAWGFLEQMRGYSAVHPNVKVRGLNIGLQDDGSVLINAMQMIGYDPLDKKALAEAKRVASIETKYIAQYIAQHIPGFENATFGGVTEEFYVRESRHIESEYTLTISDMMKHKDFEDKIAWGSYPVDIQTTDVSNWGYVIGDPVAYSVPFRSIVPKKIDNLLVASRSAGYSSIGFGSVRVVPIGMCVAEAAGVAAAYSVTTGMNFREIAYNADAMQFIQQVLRRQGAYLDDLYVPYHYEGHWAEEGIDFCYELGLIIGSYDNNIKLEEAVTEQSFYDTLKLAAKRSKMPLVLEDKVMSEESMRFTQIVDLLWEILQLDQVNVDKDVYLLQQGILTDRLYMELSKSPYVTRGMMYEIIYRVYLYTNEKAVPPSEESLF
ncbi:MAG: FAD-dependent oxidoreductase [Cellulosilyticaceae bacterium]